MLFEAPYVDFPSISMDGPSILDPSCGLGQRTLRMLGVVRNNYHWGLENSSAASLETRNLGTNGHLYTWILWEKQHVLFSVKEEAFIVVILCRHNWMKSKSWIWSFFVDAIWNQGLIVTWYIGNWELGSNFFLELEDQGKLMVISTFWMGISSEHEQTLTTTTTSNLFPRKLSRAESQWWPNLLRFLLRRNRFRLKHALSTSRSDFIWCSEVQLLQVSPRKSVKLANRPTVHPDHPNKISWFL